MRSKGFSFKCNDKNRNKLKGTFKFQSKGIKFREYYNRLFGGEYQKGCDNFLIRSLNHEMYLQRVENTTFFAIDYKRCYENNIENTPWN